MRSLKLSKLNSAFLTRPITHRGLHDQNKLVYENSRSAFDAAIRLGLPIECDIQCSQDGKAVVFHDNEMDRLTAKTGPINALTLDEISKIELGETQDQIQSFSDFLKQVDAQVPILIEIKDQSGELGQRIGGFVDDIIECIHSYTGIYAIMSFNPYPIAYLRETLPNACLGLVTDNFLAPEWSHVPRDRAERLNDIQEIPTLEIDFISHNWKDLERVKNVRVPKLCWTVKSAEDETVARKIADNITFEQFMPKST